MTEQELQSFLAGGGKVKKCPTMPPNLNWTYSKGFSAFMKTASIAHAGRKQVTTGSKGSAKEVIAK